MELKIFIQFLSTHQILSYLILFLGSFFETVIGLSFFVYGELFFLAGSILAGMGVLNIWLVVLVLYTGGLLGDSTSYFLGKKYGFHLYEHFEKKIFFKNYINQEKHIKGVKFFKKYGGYSIFLARFLGPVSWITPFLAGIHKLDYKTFLKYDIPAVVLGIGQFIVAGYLGGRCYKALFNLISKYIFIILFVLISLAITYYLLKKYNYIRLLRKNIRRNKLYLIKFIIRKLALIIILILILFVVFLGIIFFSNFSLHSQNAMSNNSPNNIDLVKLFNNCSNLKTYYKDNSTNVIQPINIIIYSNSNVDKFINPKLWIRDKIFGKDNISLKNFFNLMVNKTPPVSNLYFYNKSQDFAFQKKTNSYISREHIRFWRFNSPNKNYSNLYIASISNDNGIAFRLYNKFITPVHEIDPNIDKSRDLFKNYLINYFKFRCVYIKTNCLVKESDKDKDEQNYYTDGKILMCKER